MKRAALIALVMLAACSGEPEPGAGPGVPEGLAVPVLSVGLLTVPVADQEHMALQIALPEPTTWAPEELAYGRVVSDPSRSSVPHAPFAGTLLTGDEPVTLGTELEAGAGIFRLAPRWTPPERADLTSRRVAARAELAAQEAELPALDQALERARSLNAREKSISDRELEDAEMRFASAQARLAGARELVRALEAVGAPEGVDAVPILAPSSGVVVELLVHPGEAVEAGASLLRVEDFSSPLVSIDLPLDGSVPLQVRSARISPAGSPGITLTATAVGLDPSAGAAGLSSALLFRVDSGQRGAEALRPGLALVAWLPTGAPAQPGLLIPASAVVRLAGESFVYARRGAEAFERRALPSAHAVPGGWFVEQDPNVAEPLELVIRGAQTLLSFELLSRHGEEDGE